MRIPKTFGYINFSKIMFKIFVAGSTATSNFPETCGVLALFSGCRVSWGGQIVTDIQNLAQYASAVLTSNESAGTSYVSTVATNSGLSSFYGRDGVTNVISIAGQNYIVPLCFGIFKLDMVFDLSQFADDVTVEFFLNPDAVALFDAGGAPSTYTITLARFVIADVESSLAVKLRDGDIVHCENTQSIPVRGMATADNINLVNLSNAYRFVALFNSLNTGLALASRKFRSDSSVFVAGDDIYFTLGGEEYPTRRLNLESPIDMYLYSYDCWRPGIAGHKQGYMTDEFISRASYFTTTPVAGDGHGFFGMSLIQSPKIVPGKGEYGGHYKGLPITSGDQFNYQCAGAVAGQFFYAFIDHGVTLKYESGGFNKYK
jgi:hypothetical protein